MSAPTYVLQNSKSARASCKKCKDKIAKDVPRVGVVREVDGHAMTSWLHLACFTLPRKHAPASLDDFDVAADVAQEAQEQLQALLAAGAHNAKSKSPAAKKTKAKRPTTTSASPAKAEPGEDAAAPLLTVELDAAASPPPRKRVKAEESGDEAEAKYQAMSVAQLKDVLRANRQLLGGAKPALIARCVEGERYGAVPKCPQCGKGQLHTAPLDDGRGDGRFEYTCPGYYDELVQQRVACNFRATSDDKTVQRRRWVQPGEQPPDDEAAADGDLGEETAKLLAELAAADQGNPKEAAQLLLAAARKHGLSLPSDAKLCRVKAGAALLATRAEDGSWAGKAALTKLAEQFPKEESTQMVAKVEQNTALANAFLQLADLTAKHDPDPTFKVRAYKKVALALRDYEQAVTSGKGLKLPGVGKASQAKIDEFLETGSMAKIAELQAKSADEEQQADA